MAYKRRTKVITKHTLFGPKRVRVAMGAFGDDYSSLPQGDCGAGQKYDASIMFAGNQGQCVTADQYASAHAGTAPGATLTSSGGSFWDNLTAGLAGALKPGTTPTMPVVMPSSGISTGEMLAIGGGVVLLAVLLTRK